MYYALNIFSKLAVTIYMFPHRFQTDDRFKTTVALHTKNKTRMRLGARLISDATFRLKSMVQHFKISNL